MFSCTAARLCNSASAVFISQHLPSCPCFNVRRLNKARTTAENATAKHVDLVGCHPPCCCSNGCDAAHMKMVVVMPSRSWLPAVHAAGVLVHEHAPLGVLLWPQVQLHLTAITFEWTRPPQVRVTEVMKANLELEAAALRQELAKQEQVGTDGWVGGQHCLDGQREGRTSRRWPSRLC